jgi:fumarate reductase subunit D
LKQDATEAKSNYANGLWEDLKYAQEDAKAEHEKACATWDKAWTCLDQPTFEIGVNKLIGVWFQKKAWDDTSNTINRTLWTIIQKLMVALWVLSVLIMTVWAGYIIMYHGQDELLSKGKSIFMSGITALIVALSSYYIVSILRFILYN